MNKFFQICIFCILFLAIGIAFTNISDLQNQNTNLNNQLQQQEQTYSGKIDELTVYQEKLVERISLLEENYQKLQTAYDELKAAYDQYLLDSTLEREQLQTTVTSLNATITQLEQNSDVDAETITALRSEVSTLETSLENQTTTVNQLQATVTQQEATIAELNTTIDTLIEELNSDISGGVYKEIFDGTVTEISAEFFEGYTSIRDYAFYGVESLVSVEIPSNIETIGFYAFDRCTSLSSISFNEGLKTICSAFSETAVTSVMFPKSLESLGGGAFSYCSKLENIVFPEGSMLSTFYSGSTFSNYRGTIDFSNCQQLNTIEFVNNTFTNVILPKSITELPIYAFNSMSFLETITFLSEIPPTILDTPLICWCSELTTIYIPAGTLELYSTAKGWSSYSSKFVELSA